MSLKIKISPVVGLMVSVLIILFLAPAICLADETIETENDTVYASTHVKSGVIVSMGDSYSAGEGIQPFYGSRDSENDSELRD